MSLLPRTGRLKGLRALQRFHLEKEFKFSKYLTPWRRAELAKHVEIGEELVEAYFTMRRRGNDKTLIIRAIKIRTGPFFKFRISKFHLNPITRGD